MIQRNLLKVQLTTNKKKLNPLRHLKGVKDIKKPKVVKMLMNTNLRKISISTPCSMNMNTSQILYNSNHNKLTYQSVYNDGLNYKDNYFESFNQKNQDNIIEYYKYNL